MSDSHPLRRWLAERGLTLAQLAAQMGISPAHLSEIERWTNEPSLALAGRLSRQTGIPVEQFIRAEARP